VASPWLYPCDVSKDEDIAAVFEAARREYDSISFLVHSVAFADKEYLKLGRFTETPGRCSRRPWTSPRTR